MPDPFKKLIELHGLRVDRVLMSDVDQCFRMSLSQGKFYFETYSGFSRLEDRQNIICGSSDERNLWTSALRTLENRTLERCAVDRKRPGFETEIWFSGDLCLRVFPGYADADFPLWLVIDPADQTLRVGPKNEWKYVPNDEFFKRT